jgi:uncharacterized protein YdiU (UPF0061 family)
MQAVDDFEKQYGKSPATEYIRLTKLGYDEKDKERNELLNKLLKLYPDYFLFKLLDFELSHDTQKHSSNTEKKLFEMVNQTKGLTDYEFVKFLFVYYQTVYSTFEKKHEEDEELERTIAFIDFVEDNVTYDYDEKTTLLYLSRVEKIVKTLTAIEKKVAAK